MAASGQESKGMREALRWALDYMADGQQLKDETPIHACEYITHPERGACEFHENYWTAREMVESASDSPAAPASEQRIRDVVRTILINRNVDEEGAVQFAIAALQWVATASFNRKAGSDD